MLVTNENYIYMIWNYTRTLLLKKYKFRIILCCSWRHIEKKSCVNLVGRQTLYCTWLQCVLDSCLVNQICIARTSGKTDSGLHAKLSTSPIQNLRLTATFKLKIHLRCASLAKIYASDHSYYPLGQAYCEIPMNIDIFFALFLGGISCDSSSLTTTIYNVLMRANFEIGALYREAHL